MKKYMIPTVIILAPLIACAFLLNDGPVFLVAALMGFTILFAINRSRTNVMKMTRWSKANPRKAQVVITVLQVALLSLGILAGNNLKELGYELSNTISLVFGAILLIGFLYVPFFPQRKVIAIPRQVNRQRFAFMSIALSAFVLMVYFGNTLQDKYPNSFITRSVKAIDQAIFPENPEDTAPSDLDLQPALSESGYQPVEKKASGNMVFASYALTENMTILPPADVKGSKENLKAEKRVKRFEKKKARLMNLIQKHRKAFAGMSTGIAVLLIILLLIPLCAGVCLIISGGAGGIAGGLALLALSIFGIIKIGRSVRKNKEAKQ